MKPIIDYSELINGLRKYKSSGKTFIELANAAKNVTTSATIGRYANGKVEEPSLTIWFALHNAAPEFISPPPVVMAQRQLPVRYHNDYAEEEDLGEERRVPVFDAGAGSNCFWDDGGYPVGHSDEYLLVPMRESDKNTFGVRVHGNSMAPRIEDGDRVIVVPSRCVEHGRACFVTHYDDPQGEKLIRRYFKYGDMVILKPDNPAEGFEIQITSENADQYGIFAVTEVRKRYP